MPGSLSSHQVAALIRINRVFAEERNVRLVQYQHLRRQEEHRVVIDFLVGKGFSSDDLKPTAKLTEDMYRTLQQEFQQDKVAKQNAEKIELTKAAAPAEPKKKKDEEDLSFKKKEAAPPVEKPAPVAAPDAGWAEPAVENKKTEPAESNGAADIVKIEAPELEAPKVVKKIDLDAIDSSTRPKKTAKKTEEKKTIAKKETKPAPEEPKAPEPPAPEEPKPDAPAAIENIKAERLEGPKILGKIELPVDSDTRPKREADDKRKRKRERSVSFDSFVQGMKRRGLI